MPDKLGFDPKPITEPSESDLDESLCLSEVGDRALFIEGLLFLWGETFDISIKGTLVLLLMIGV